MSFVPMAQMTGRSMIAPTPPKNRRKTPPIIKWAGLCSFFDYRYCLMASEALLGSSETEMVSFMLLLSQNLAAQAMNSSP